MLKVSDISAGYGKAQILSDVSLEVPEGKLVVVTGPNGHGKTTLLRVLSGLIQAWSGTATFMEEPLLGCSPATIVARGLVQIPQGDLLFQDLTVEQNLLMGAFVKASWEKRLQGLERVFALFPRLEERRGQQARTLSGGERRMCAIGRGLMSETRLLMVDEPALGLAPVLVQELYSTLREISRSEATVFLVEESFEHVESIADYVYLMENGRIVHHGTVAAILANEQLRSVYLGA
ncbi:MAG: ABC transporter ATP-binding protein [Armatimonadota bacterium]